ncbi:MAG: molecular chaperone TorD family protein [Betaproteobacteria bacterium]|nr:molecular chaperone TorD family protein [Betaproteobacteria bacterium]
MNESPNPDAARLAAEDVGRANLYALIGRLFYGPPDAALYAEICRSGQEVANQDASRLAAGWRALQKACGSVSPVSVRQEYDDLFVGVGRAPVTPYLSGYAEPASPDRHLVRLRDQLSGWGFLRRSNVFEVEDHVSALCDVMRFLIEDSRPLEEQQRFFAGFVHPGATAFFAALQQAPSADFYKIVATFAQAFFEVEKEAFQMIDSA